VKFILTALLTLAFVACVHNKSNTPDQRIPASEVRDSHLTPEEVQTLSKILTAKDEKQIDDLLRTTAITQSLVASFDERAFALRTREDSDKLMGSSLYCKILNLRSIQERVDEKAIQAFEFTANRPEDRAWLFGRMAAFAGKSALNEVAMAQLFRTIQPHEQRICGSQGCVEREIQNLKFRVSPFDDEAVAKFSKDNRAEIAKYSRLRSYDLNPGTCFGETRQPQQVSSYDWKNRNWVGSVLAEGSFAITYDDGPSALYTRAIRDVWAQAGMAKPSFFWLTKEAIKNPDIVKELHNQGYTIGSHSWGHPDIGNLARSFKVSDLNKQNQMYFAKEIPGITNYAIFKKAALDREIPEAAKQLGSIMGDQVKYFRLPYGSGVKNEIVANYFQQMNVEHFFWRVDSLDWQDKNPASVRDRVVAQMNAVKKGIVLFHDIHPQSLKAAELLVQYFKQNPSFRAVPLNSIPGLEQ
jgi:peptidoglycan/xylan/chitin deacetylase (PgdA/CDA1 family)